MILRESAVHGLGMFAARRLVLGDIILEEDPVLINPPGLTPDSKGYVEKMCKSLSSQFKKLDPHKQVRSQLSLL